MSVTMDKDIQYFCTDTLNGRERRSEKARSRLVALGLSSHLDDTPVSAPL